MIYGYKFKEYHIEIYKKTGVFYKNNKLLFKGQIHDALIQFVAACDDKTVYNKFKGQIHVNNVSGTSDGSIGQVHRGQGSESKASS